nr:glycoside hydrolase family 9 protein [Vibrio agarilyticus]
MSLSVILGSTPTLADELLLNGQFSDKSNNWWGSGGSLDEVAGTGCLTFNDAGQNRWDVILGQGGFGLSEGETYTVSFDIKANNKTKGVVLIQHDGAPYDQYFSKELNIGTEFKKHEYTFKYNSKNDPKTGFQFQLGSHKANTVCVDNVSVSGKEFKIVRNYGKLRANQVGYFPKGEKFAVLHSDSTQPQTWQLIDKNDDVLFSGKTKVFGVNAASGEHVHQIDFSHVDQTLNAVKIKVGEELSHPFDIKQNVYSQLAEDALKYFYHNRSGIEVKPEFVQRADLSRPAGHPKDSASCFKGKDAQGNIWPGCDFSIDGTGGWYDAGDHGKYLVNSGISTWTLLNLYERGIHGKDQVVPFSQKMKRIPESGNGVNDLLDEARWNIEFMLAMQIPEGKKVHVPVGDQHSKLADLTLTEIDASGMAFHKIADEKWTGFPMAPHNDTQKRSVSHPSTSATLNLAAIGAQCSRIWKEIDAEFANQCLTAAQSAWQAANAHPEVYAYDNFTGSGPYGDGQLADEFYWAAAELFITTGAAKYRDFITASEEFLATPSVGKNAAQEFYWQYMAPAGTFSLALVPNALTKEQVAQARANIVTSAEMYASQLDQEGYRLPFTVEAYTWGSNSAIVNRAIILVYGFDYSGKEEYLVSAANAMDYILGRNPLSYSYVTGYGSDPFKNPHHRFWAYQANNDYPKAPAGVLSGGPNSVNFSDPVASSLQGKCTGQTCYVDDLGAWTLNEVTINWNAPLVWISSALNTSILN